jgi:hypothetical protein
VAAAVRVWREVAFHHGSDVLDSLECAAGSGMFVPGVFPPRPSPYYLARGLRPQIPFQPTFSRRGVVECARREFEERLDHPLRE